jgi:hypothetical protein
MVVTLTPGAVKKFRRTPWRFQRTVERPSPGDLERFVSTIFAAHDELQAATVTIDRVIFDTVRLDMLCPSGSKLSHDFSIVGNSPEEARGLLAAAFWDSPDFICVPTPKPFVIYADHDDWITFFANSKSCLNHVIEPLTSDGFKAVPNWRREF